MNGSILQLINLRSHLCAGVILICYTVLTSPKNDETAVHGCNSTFWFLSCWCLEKSTFLLSMSALQFCLFSNNDDFRDTLNLERVFLRFKSVCLRLKTLKLN